MKKFKIDYSFLILFILLFFSPKQNLIFQFFFCLFLHELGHLFFVFLFRLKIQKLRISVFGFFLELERKKESFIKDLFLYSGGIIMNGIVYLIVPIPSMRYINLFLIVINAIPIYPLDGYNLFKSVLSYFFSYYYSLKISCIFSLITNIFVLCILFYNHMDLVLIINYFYLLFLNMSLGFHQKIIFNKFILERQLYSFDYPIKSIHFHDKVKNHIYKYFQIEMNLAGKCISEKELLEFYSTAKI